MDTKLQKFQNFLDRIFDNKSQRTPEQISKLKVWKEISVKTYNKPYLLNSFNFKAMLSFVIILVLVLSIITILPSSNPTLNFSKEKTLENEVRIDEQNQVNTDENNSNSQNIDTNSSANKKEAEKEIDNLINEIFTDINALDAEVDFESDALDTI